MLSTHCSLTMISKPKALNLSTLCKLLQLPLLLHAQRLIQRIEFRQVLSPSSNEELRKVSLRLIIPLSREAPLSLPIRHEFGLGASESEIQDVGVDVFPSVIVGFFVCELGGCGCCCRGRRCVSSCGGEFFDEDFEDFEGRGDDGELVRV